MVHFSKLNLQNYKNVSKYTFVNSTGVVYSYKVFDMNHQRDELITDGVIVTPKSVEICKHTKT